MTHTASVDSRVFVPRGDFMAWLVCISAGLFFFYEFFQLNIFDVINQPLRKDFHLNATELSWMSSTYLWADILFLLPAGIILDRFSIRKVILASMLLCISGTIGFALTHSFILASFFHFLSGIGNAFCFLSCMVLISQWFPPKRQAFVVGSIVTLAFIGGMMAHTPFAYLNELFGWREALLLDGLAGIGIWFVIYLLVQDQPEGAPTRFSAKPGFSGFRKALANKQNWLAGLYTSLLNLPIMILCALWGASYLQVAYGISDMAASNIISLILMGSIIGCPAFGWLSDLQGKRKPLMLLGAVLTLITVLPLFLHIPLSTPMLSILFFSLGFFTSTQVLSYPLIAKSNDPENTGSSTGIASVIIMGGGGVGQVLFGWLIAHHANLSATGYSLADFQFAMWVFPIAAVIAIAAVFMTKEPA